MTSPDKWVAGRDHLNCTLSCRNTNRDANSADHDTTRSSVEVRIEIPEEVGEHEIAVHCPLCGSDAITAMVAVRDREARMRDVKQASFAFMGVAVLFGGFCVWGLFSEPDDTTWAWLLPLSVLMLGYCFLESIGKGVLSRAAAGPEGLTGALLEYRGHKHRLIRHHTPLNNSRGRTR